MENLRQTLFLIAEKGGNISLSLRKSSPRHSCRLGSADHGLLQEFDRVGKSLLGSHERVPVPYGHKHAAADLNRLDLRCLKFDENLVQRHICKPVRKYAKLDF